MDQVEREYPEGTTYEEIAREYQKEYSAPIVLAQIEGKLTELFKPLNRDGVLKFVTMAEASGIQSYHRSAVLLALKSFYDVVGHDKVQHMRVKFSVSKGLYIEPKGDFVLDEGLLQSVEVRMRELVEKGLPIEKRMVNTDEAVEIFRKYGMTDKERLFYYRRVSKVNLYRINEFEDYYYGYMVPNTRYLKWFGLYRYADGFVLQLPQKEDPTVVPPFEPQHKIFEVLQESSHWSARLGVNTVGELNDLIVSIELE